MRYVYTVIRSIANGNSLTDPYTYRYADVGMSDYSNPDTTQSMPRVMHNPVYIVESGPAAACTYNSYNSYNARARVARDADDVRTF